MGKLKNRTVIIGEGITEFYYVKSLVDRYPGIGIKPDCPKHTNMGELAKKIEECVNDGYRYILCIIDMDTKDKKTEMKIYQELRRKYASTISQPKKGILCDVLFYETHLCTELFFLYYFDYTTRHFENQEQLLHDLNRRCAYEKTEKFFRRSKGLHSYFEKNGGSLKAASERSDRSCRERESQARDYTYSELGRLISKLDEINSSK